LIVAAGPIQRQSAARPQALVGTAADERHHGSTLHVDGGRGGGRGVVAHAGCCQHYLVQSVGRELVRDQPELCWVSRRRPQFCAQAATTPHTPRVAHISRGACALAALGVRGGGQTERRITQHRAVARARDGHSGVGTAALDYMHGLRSRGTGSQEGDQGHAHDVLSRGKLAVRHQERTPERGVLIQESLQLPFATVGASDVKLHRLPRATARARGQ